MYCRSNKLLPDELLRCRGKGYRPYFASEVFNPDAVIRQHVDQHPAGTVLRSSGRVPVGLQPTGRRHPGRIKIRFADGQHHWIRNGSANGYSGGLVKPVVGERHRLGPAIGTCGIRIRG